MSLYTGKEWAALCRTTTNIIRANISRGKVIVYDNKIDSEDPINKQFFDRYSKKAEDELRKKNKLKETEQDIDKLYNQVVEKVERKIVLKKKNTEVEKGRKASAAKSQKKIDWLERKQKADALLQERKAEKEQMQLEKIAGKLMPTELCFNVVRVHNQSIFATFQNDLENLSSIYCDILADGDRSYLSELNVKLGEYLEKIIGRAEEVAMASLENAVEEYSQTRNRGERK